MWEPELKQHHTHRAVKCRLCNKMIPKDYCCYVMKNVHVSPRRIDLYFHIKCLDKAVDGVQA